jgi:hypothetical protein
MDPCKRENENRKNMGQDPLHSLVNDVNIAR